MTARVRVALVVAATVVAVAAAGGAYLVTSPTFHAAGGPDAQGAAESPPDAALPTVESAPTSEKKKPETYPLRVVIGLSVGLV